MSTPLIPVILESGLQAIWRATHDGIAAQITHVALGDAGYTPTQRQIGLVHERARYPIADGELMTPNRIHLTALADDGAEFWVREVGFVLSDGTVFAVWSHPSTPLAYKAAGVELLLAYDLELTAVPAGSVVVQSTGAGLSLAFSPEFAAFATAQIDAMTRDLAQRERIDALEARIKRIEQLLSHHLS
ncbi:MAG: phage tail protein [Thiohalomonadaceae bacterium]